MKREKTKQNRKEKQKSKKERYKNKKEKHDEWLEKKEGKNDTQSSSKKQKKVQWQLLSL